MRKNRGILGLLGAIAFGFVAVMGAPGNASATTMTTIDFSDFGALGGGLAAVTPLLPDRYLAQGVMLGTDSNAGLSAWGPASYSNTPNQNIGYGNSDNFAGRTFEIFFVGPCENGGGSAGGGGGETSGYDCGVMEFVIRIVDIHTNNDPRGAWSLEAFGTSGASLGTYTDDTNDEVEIALHTVLGLEEDQLISKVIFTPSFENEAVDLFGYSALTSALPEPAGLLPMGLALFGLRRRARGRA